jgi:serine/threonine protein kinase
MNWEIKGDTTGRVWKYRPIQTTAPGSGEHYEGVAADDGSHAWIHRLEKGSLWDDEVELMRTAISVACEAPVAASSVICRLLDVNETKPKNIGGVEKTAYLSAIWEFADISLDDFIEKPDCDRELVAQAVSKDVADALDVLHNIGFIHLDVAPNNIVRVDRIWKLADLGSCTRRGCLALHRPGDGRLVHPDLQDGRTPAARDEFDSYALNALLGILRGK